MYLCFFLCYFIFIYLYLKDSGDEDLEDGSSECVICMSDMRDTLILPCRHLCLCQSCADSLRYQANNCPICRVPFRALLQIKALQKTLDNNHRVIKISYLFINVLNIMLSRINVNRIELIFVNIFRLICVLLMVMKLFL